MLEQKSGIETIEKIAEEMTAPAQTPTEEEKLAAAKEIVEGIDEPEKSKPKNLKVESVPAPPDDSHLDGRGGGPAGKKTTKKARKKMAKEDRKHPKKGEEDHGGKPGEQEPGKPSQPVSPGKGKELEPKPKRDWGPLI